MNSFRFLSSASLLVALAAAYPAAAQERPLVLPGAEAREEAPVALPPGATIGGAQERVRNMATEASRGLDELIGQALTPRSEAEVGELAERKRRVQLLTMQVEEAKLARELYVLTHGEDDGKEDEIERLVAEREMLQAEVEFLRENQHRVAASSSQNDPDPVVSEITGAGGQMRAVILVPYHGRYELGRGGELPNGMKVAEISRTGVTVTAADGSRRRLAFGDSVPSARILPAQAAR